MTVGAPLRLVERLTLSAEFRFDAADGARPFRDGRDDATTTFASQASLTF